MKDNYSIEHSTQYYADRLFITPDCLNKIARKTFGKSAKKYILDVVFDEACRRLLYTDATIDEIADAMGFETSTYFIRTFRKRYGVTPLQFRKQDENPRNRG